MFSEDDFNLVAAAVKAFIATDSKGYPPHIGAIKEKMRMLVSEDYPTPLEAWNGIWDDLRKNNWSYRKTFENLPTIVKGIVGSASTLETWAGLKTETCESVVSSNFQKSYRYRVKKKQDYDAIPTDLKKMYKKSWNESLPGGHSFKEIKQPMKKYSVLTDKDGNEYATEEIVGDADE